MSLLSRGNAPSGGSPWGWFTLVAAVLAALIFACALTSCGTTRDEEHHEATEIARRFTVRGTVSVPTTRTSDGATVVVALPVDLVLDGGGTDETVGEGHARTRVEAPEISGALIAGLKQAFPALAFLGQAQMGPAPAAPSSPWIPDQRTLADLGLGAVAAERWWASIKARRAEDEAWDAKHRAELEAAKATPKAGT